MKRTPPWVWAAAAGVQLAALCLWDWAMERPGSSEGGTERVEEFRASREALAPAAPPGAADVAFAKHPGTRSAPGQTVVRPVQPLEPRESARVEPDEHR